MYGTRPGGLCAPGEELHVSKPGPSFVKRGGTHLPQEIKPTAVGRPACPPRASCLLCCRPVATSPQPPRGRCRLGFLNVLGTTSRASLKSPQQTPAATEFSAPSRPLHLPTCLRSTKSTTPFCTPHPDGRSRAGRTAGRLPKPRLPLGPQLSNASGSPCGHVRPRPTTPGPTLCRRGYARSRPRPLPRAGCAASVAPGERLSSPPPGGAGCRHFLCFGRRAPVIGCARYYAPAPLTDTSRTSA